MLAQRIWLARKATSARTINDLFTLCIFVDHTWNSFVVIDLINVLVNSGRHIDAVNLAISFELTEQFSPVWLLKSYLNESRRQCSPIAQNDAMQMNEKEGFDLKYVIKFIEDHKLQNHYPLDPIKKRILQLEKAKVEKKRAMEVSKPQHKRPRANGVAAGYMPRNTNYARSMHHQLSTRMPRNTKFVGVVINFNYKYP